MKYAPQPEIVENSGKNLFCISRSFKVIDIGIPQKACQQCLLW